jgi:valyl-tRNA synthetase
MPSRKINTRNFFLRKKDLLDALGLVFLVMRPCRNCAMSSKIYCVSDDSKKCVKCVRFDRDCDLAISLASIKRIHEERMRLKKEVREARAKLSRLKKQLDFLENKEKKMIVTKWKNIDDLKMDEAHFAKFVAKIFELLFDVSFE